MRIHTKNGAAAAAGQSRRKYGVVGTVISVNMQRPPMKGVA